MYDTELLTEAQLALRVVMDGVSRAAEEQLSATAIAERLGMKRSTVYELLETSARIDSRKYRDLLREEAEKYLRFPWGDEGRKARQTVIEVLDAPFKYGNDTAMEQRRAAILTLFHEATVLWLPHALDTSAAPWSRVLYGLLGSSVILDLELKKALRQEEVLGTQVWTDLNLNSYTDTLSKVDEQLCILLDDAALPKLFDGELTDAKLRGARWLRLRAWNNRIAREYDRLPSQERDDMMRKAVKKGFVEDCNWADDLTGNTDIVLPFNAWMACVHASDWDTSLSQAERLFSSYPDLLEKSYCGLGTLHKDKSAWPGLAAIAARPEARDLAPIHHALSNAGDLLGNPELELTVKQMSALIAAGGATYQTAYEQIGDKS